MRGAERSKVWQWWLRVVGKGMRGPMRRAASAAVDEQIDDPRVEVLVAEHSAVPGEPLGFVAHMGSRLLMVFVLGEVGGIPVRRKGIGTALLDAAVPDHENLTIAYWTASGRRLVDAWRQRRRVAA